MFNMLNEWGQEDTEFWAYADQARREREGRAYVDEVTRRIDLEYAAAAGVGAFVAWVMSEGQAS